VLIVVLVGAYAYRTVNGIRAGWAFDRGHLLRNLGDYTAAAPRLKSAAVGLNGVRSLQMSGEVRLDLWELQVRRGGALGADASELARAARDFLTCRCLAPASRRSWKGLGEVYDAVEWIGREQRAETPYVKPKHPWARVGRPGRIAVGMLEAAMDVSPAWSRLHDKLALTLWNYGLEGPAREAVRASARALPVFYRHPYYKIPELPDWVAEEFAQASREVLGQAPLFPRSAHLLDLGKLERRIGANDRAVEALQEALGAGKDQLRQAEVAFHLGLALIDEGRPDEGRSHLESASEHPAFRPSALRSLANLAEAQGEYEQALGHLRQLRWEQPGELGPCLAFAEVARRMGEWPAALESLRWAKIKHPSDPRPYVELAETHLAMDDPPAASSIVDELAEMLGDDAVDVVRLQEQIDIASRTAGGRF
jgi:tetratricopeptide (TPR) repeat protein